MATQGSSKRVTVLIPLPTEYPPTGGVSSKIGTGVFRKTAVEICRFAGGGVIHRSRKGSSVGYWLDKGVVHQDVLALLEFDVSDCPENREWVREYAQEVLLKRFRQLAIYVKFVAPVETLLITDEKVEDV